MVNVDSSNIGPADPVNMAIGGEPAWKGFLLIAKFSCSKVGNYEKKTGLTKLVICLGTVDLITFFLKFLVMYSLTLLAWLATIFSYGFPIAEVVPVHENVQWYKNMPRAEFIE